jgi:hypothetical protein
MQPSAIAKLALAAVLAFAAATPAGGPWDKPAKDWTLADTYKILRDSPWSPSRVSIEASYTQRHADPLTGVVGASTTNIPNTGLVRGVELSTEKPLPDVSVLWWSSKTIRLAHQRLAQLRSSSGNAAGGLQAGDLPDYVVAIEGQEPQRIFLDAKSDLHDTVFLELENGLALDFTSVNFVEATETDDARTEFHFPRMREGQTTIDSNSERIIFHCRAEAKNPRQSRENAISVRVEFKPSGMRVRNVPDL